MTSDNHDNNTPVQVKGEPQEQLSVQLLLGDAGEFKCSLPPRKRARTSEEKEQRRVERIMRNRRAARQSRERKRRHMEFLERKCALLECILQSVDAEKLLPRGKKHLWTDLKQLQENTEGGELLERDLGDDDIIPSPPGSTTSPDKKMKIKSENSVSPLDIFSSAGASSAASSACSNTSPFADDLSLQLGSFEPITPPEFEINFDFEQGKNASSTSTNTAPTFIKQENEDNMLKFRNHMLINPLDLISSPTVGFEMRNPEVITT
ncbi:transcription factor HAC1 KNAG_0E03230 [Huiozyma naganishii CBS 8797]|uniref:BZIP domain-containing protein n=1 Tax=Huiozyma naganishii (strain ATCC MYA-139 / BCRC 22969 / CBS 8797 / KCTC 17520 / NBRC 10181 / NCYC 3082 / Yp74L-3) TaxID=1071383 RepID=J7RZF0_HUIN7|nr:hypothetical protein KNAG_0E03230 [Kazachstania naganishii CBS 8797]CCK70582.1 hypothetical protein KNAG_0E03230 [Kazachstania naganishii CBS 8797]